MYPEGLRARPRARLSARVPVSTTLRGRDHQQAHLRGDDAEARREGSHLVLGGGDPPPLWPSQRQACRGPRPLTRGSLHSPPALHLLSCLGGPQGDGALLSADPLLEGPTAHSQAHRPYGPPTTSTPAFRQKARALGPGGTGPSERTPRLLSALAAQPSWDLTPIPSTFNAHLPACFPSMNTGRPPGHQTLLQDEPTSRLCLHPALLSRGWTTVQPVVGVYLHPQ